LKAALVFVAACSSPPKTRPAPVPAIAQEIVDMPDRCPMLSCIRNSFEDNDGCPDPDLVIPFAHGSTALPPDATKILEGVARDEPRLDRDSHILVQGEAAPDEAPGIETRRALAVVSALRARGVPAARIIPGVTPATHLEPAERVVIECD
jgi:hypothetical protein